jgi:hypothetical protein
MYFEIAKYKLEKRFFLRLNSLCYALPYYANILEKYAPILLWLKFKRGHPSKIV